MPNTKSAIRRVRRVKNKLKLTGLEKEYKNAVKQMEKFIKSKDHKSKKIFFKISINSNAGC